MLILRSRGELGAGAPSLGRISPRWGGQKHRCVSRDASARGPGCWLEDGRPGPRFRCGIVESPRALSDTGLARSLLGSHL